MESIESEKWEAYTRKEKEIFTTVQETKNEFYGRRKLVLRCLNNISKKSLDNVVEIVKDKFGGREIYQVDTLDTVSSMTIVFPNGEVTKEAVAFLKVQLRIDFNIGYFSNSTLMFVGNIPYSFCRSDLYELFEPYGEILRCLVVYNEHTGESKGYGFVELATEEEALSAKFALAKKRLFRRKLRVDFASMKMVNYSDIHSRTLFVDCLPKTLSTDAALFQYFSTFGAVKFCQVAMDPETRKPRQFAFIDMATSLGAELAHQAANKSLGQHQAFRASYGMPCRPGSSILQNNVPQTALDSMPVTLKIPVLARRRIKVHMDEESSDSLSDQSEASPPWTPSLPSPRDNYMEVFKCPNSATPYQLWSVKPHEQGIQYIDPLERITGKL